MGRVRLALLLVAVALLAGACGTPPRTERPVNDIDEDRYRDQLGTLASAEFAGRRPGTDGEARTVAYLSEQFRRLKLKPLSGGRESDWEGCLSVPGMRGMVPRWTHIRYCGFDPSGDPIDRTVQGFHARVVQHECDHLWGKLYPMRMRDFSKFGFSDALFPDQPAAQDD